VLVELVAASLAPEAIEKELVAKVTVGQLEEGFPYLKDGKSERAFRGESYKIHKNIDEDDGHTFLLIEFDIFELTCW